MPGVVDQIKSRLDIVEVVSEKVILKKTGKSFKGLCPFHSEKTPSFIVFPESGTWHCFGCGAGGDAFGFVMQSQNMEFSEALTALASRAGVELQSERRFHQDTGELDALVSANDAALAYFCSMLAGPAGSDARAYVEKRHLSPASVEEFSIGFAPDRGAGLANHLVQLGLARAVVLQAGLAGENDSGALYDRFRGRLMFAIRDQSGRIVGFGGRALGPGVEPKYLNTPQTPLFDKGGILYAIDRAKQEIRRSGQAVIVEGYMDAIMAHQHGFRNVVASMGTAVTDRQMGQLKRLATDLCFALDPDTAGQEATARGLAVAMGAMEKVATPVPNWKGLVEYVYSLKTTIRIMSLPAGQDPDDLIRSSPTEWQRLVAEAKLVQDFFLERVARKHDLSTAAGKSAAAEEALAVITQIPDPVQQAHYIQRLAGMIAVEESVLLQRARRNRGGRGNPQLPAAPSPVEGLAGVESYLLALLLRNPRLIRSEPVLAEESFGDPAYREILRRLLSYVESDEAVRGGPELVEALKGEMDPPLQETLDQLSALWSNISVFFPDDPEQEYREAALTLLLGNLDRKRRQLNAMLMDSESGEDREQVDNQLRPELDRIYRETHRLKLMGGTVPLRSINKEVRHGG